MNFIVIVSNQPCGDSVPATAKLKRQATPALRGPAPLASRCLFKASTAAPPVSRPRPPITQLATKMGPGPAGILATGLPSSQHGYAELSNMWPQSDSINKI